MFAVPNISILCQTYSLNCSLSNSTDAVIDSSYLLPLEFALLRRIDRRADRMEIPEYEAKFYEGTITEGNILIVVPSANSAGQGSSNAEDMSHLTHQPLLRHERVTTSFLPRFFARYRICQQIPPI